MPDRERGAGHPAPCRVCHEVEPRRTHNAHDGSRQKDSQTTRSYRLYDECLMEEVPSGRASESLTVTWAALRCRTLR